MKYAVIRIKGNQYKVSEGEEILVDRLSKTDKIVPEILLGVDEDHMEIGKSVVKKAKVGLKIMGEEKGRKLYIQTYKAKSRYRRKIGFRPKYSRLKISKISIK